MSFPLNMDLTWLPASILLLRIKRTAPALKILSENRSLVGTRWMQLIKLFNMIIIPANAKDMKNRSRTEIVVQILEIANVESGSGYDEADGVIQTKIMYNALLSYAQLKEYLRVLTENDLLSYHSASRKFKTTEKGHRFLEIYNRMENVMREQQQQPSPPHHFHNSFNSSRNNHSCTSKIRKHLCR
ncbi:MAG TPA: winged helix-turn-helix domain-containing protein [Nitrososphaera sp.]